MRNFRPFVLWALVILVFILGVAQGLRISFKRNLWTDEMYSLTSSIQNKTWSDILCGRVVEGNNSPLFYLVEKSWINLTGFSGLKRIELGGFGENTAEWWRAVALGPESGLALSPWQKRALVCFKKITGAFWDVSGASDLYRWQLRSVLMSRIVLRLPAIIFMAFALAFLAWYFAGRYSFALAGMALGIALGSNMVWFYWVEARPYSMIILFSLMQAAFFFEAQKDKYDAGAWTSLVIVNWLLALTAAQSVIPLAMMALVLFSSGCRRAWVWSLGIVAPLVVALAYYALADHYNFSLASFVRLAQLVTINIPWPHLLALFILPAAVWVWRKRRGELLLAAEKSFVGWIWSAVLAFVVFLVFLFFTQRPGALFPVSARYVIFLSALDLVAVPLLVSWCWGEARSFSVRLLVLAVTALLVAPGLVRAIGWLVKGGWPEYAPW